MASTLDIMADVADKAFHSLVPSQANGSARFRKGSQRQQQQQQQNSIEAKTTRSPRATSPSQQPETQQQAPCSGEAVQQGQVAGASLSTAANGAPAAATPQVSLASRGIVELSQRPSAEQPGPPSVHSAGQAVVVSSQAAGEEGRGQEELVGVPPMPEAYPVVEEEDNSSSFQASLNGTAAGMEPAPSRTLSLTMAAPPAAAAAAAAAAANGVAAGASRGSSGPWEASAQVPSRQDSSRDQAFTVNSGSTLQHALSETPSQLSVYVPLPGAATSAKVFGRHYLAFLPSALTVSSGRGGEMRPVLHRLALL